MRPHRYVLLLVAVLPIGCTGLKQFPDGTSQFQKTLQERDQEYSTALDAMYKKGRTPEQRKAIRNGLIELRLAVIDEHFEAFVRSLVRESAIANLGISLTGVGIGGAGAILSGGASQILSAVSGALTGAQAAYDKEVLFEKTLQSLVAQMIAGRKKVASEIFRRWDHDTTSYPLWVARRDLQAYEFAGSLPGAILATATDAAAKEAQANVFLLDEVTEEAVTARAFEERKTLREAIDGLSADAAKALVTEIANEFPEAKALVDANYPDAVRNADPTGDKAKALLKRLVVLTAKTEAERATWRAAVGIR